MTGLQKTIVCREGGMDCDWEVRDSDEQELLTAALQHVQRRHPLDVAPQQVRPLMREVRRGVGGL